MPESQEIEKPGFFARIKHRLSRGVIVAAGSYVIIMFILLATNRTQFSADVFLLWMLMPVLYISIFTAFLAELTWSLSAHFAKKAKNEE